MEISESNRHRSKNAQNKFNFIMKNFEKPYLNDHAFLLLGSIT